MNEITMRPVGAAGSTQLPAAGGKETAAGDFAEILGRSMDAVNERMQEADLLVRGLAEGRHANIHETMIAMEQSGISFRLMTRVQQKVVDAYREVMRMQL